MTKLMLKGKHSYQIEQTLGGNDRFNVYRVSSDIRPDQELLLKIAKTTAQNSLLDREAFLLSRMSEEAERLEEEYARITEGKGQLNYQVGFPKFVETFLAESQGNRRVIIASLAVTDSVGDFVSLSMVSERDRVRIDPKTSAWVMGKLLKILAFVHNQAIKNNNLGGGNILIDRGHHLVTIYDWSAAVIYPSKISLADAREEIQSAAREIVRVLGGDVTTGEIPEDEQLSDTKYQDVLTSLLRGVYSNAGKAHSAFYKVVEALWGKQFHPYTSYPLERE